MSQNNTNAKTAMLAKLDSIHKVEGFDRPRLPWIIRISIRRRRESVFLS